MARPIRVEFPGATYHIMSHAVAGTATFSDDLEAKRFLELLQEIADIRKLVVHAYCLMKDHFHMLCETPEARLSRHMQQLLERYTRWFNRRRHRHGHLWQARYKAILVQDGEYFLHCSRYIHLNPVKAHLCAMPEDYPWSSYRFYLQAQESHGWIARSKTLNCFADIADYSSFVLDGLQQDLEDPFEAAAGGLAFGSNNFVDQIRMLVRIPHLLEDVPGIRDLKRADAPSLDAIRAAVNDSFPSLSECRRMRMFIYAIRRFTTRTGREIAEITRRCPSAVTHIWRDIQTRLTKDPELQRQFETLAQLLGKGPAEP